MDTANDEELVRAANNLDPQAFAELYARHRGFVFRLARRLTRDDDLAAEVVQDVFTWWLGRFPGFKLTAKVTTFLYPVTRNAAISRLRAQRRTASEEGRSGEREATGFGVEATDHEIDAELARALGELPEDAREIVLLRYGADLSGPEIARALELPEGTVRSRLYAAARLLRTRLEGSGKDSPENRASP